MQDDDAALRLRGHSVPRWLAALFVALVLPLGLFLAMATPTGQVADEVGHMLRAAALADGAVMGHRVAHPDPIMGVRLGTGVDYDPMLVAVANEVGQQEKLLFTRRMSVQAIRWSGKSIYIELGTIGVYLPVFYLPAALGIAVSKGVGASPFVVFEVGRLANLAVFMALSVAALLVARRAHGLLFCVLAVPMSVSLGASFNQDGLLIATATLAAALLSASLEPGVPPEAVARRPGYILAAVLIGLIATVKLPYLPLAAMLLVPLPVWGQWRAQQAAMRRRMAVVAVVALVALVWTGTVMAVLSSPVPWPVAPAGPLWPGDPARLFDATDPAAQIRVLIAHPLAAVTLVWNSIVTNEWLVREGIGMLGWLDLLLPDGLYEFWMCVIVAAVAAALLSPRPSGPERPAAVYLPRALQVAAGGLGWRDILLLVASAAGCVWVIYLSQYLTWTTVGADHVDGPQGRYFLPLLPMLALAIPRLALSNATAQTAGRFGWAMLTAAPVVGALASLALVPMAVIARWYMH